MRLPTLHENNLACTAAILGLAGVIGSAVSFLVSGAGMVNIFHVARGKFPLSREHTIRLIYLGFVLYVAAQTLAIVVNYDRPESLLEIVTFLPFLGMIFIYSRFRASSSTRSLLNAMEIGAVAGSFATFALAMSQIYLFPVGRAEGIAGNPGPFATINVLLLAICLSAATRRTGLLQILALLAAAAAAVSVILSGMRGTWPALVIVPIIVLWGSTVRFRLGAMHYASLAAVMLVLAAIAYQGVAWRFGHLTLELNQSFAQGNFDNPVGQRIAMWKAGIELFGEKPVFGYGSSQLSEAMIGKTSELFDLTLGYSHFHNFLVDAMVRAGLFGAASLLFMLIAPVVVVFRHGNGETAGPAQRLMLALVATYATCGLTGIMLGHDILDALFIYGVTTFSFLALAGDGDPQIVDAQ